MRPYLIKIILTLGILFGYYKNSYAQGNSSIEINFLTANFTDTIGEKDVVLVFLVSTKDTTNFPPVISLPPKCTVFEGGREKVILLTQSNFSVALYDQNIETKNKMVYNLIKNKISLSSMQTTMIITYNILNLNYNFSKMTLTPAFREKKNNAIRTEKRFEINVE